jgi:hypothetical protein
MRTEDFSKFEALMTTLSELYDKSPSEAALKMYAIALKDFSIEEITRGVERAITELKWFPKPAELLELMQGSATDRSEQAWEILWNAYLKAGYWDSVLFQDGAIARTVQIVFGGWVIFSEAMKETSPEMIQAKRKQFIATYRREALNPKEPMRLPGHHEIQNLNSVSTWTRDQFSDTYKQRVFVAQAEGSRFVEASFHRNSAQMIENDVQLLNAARLPQLPAKPRLELLPAPSKEARDMTPEQIKAQIAQLTRQISGKGDGHAAD